MRLFYIVAAHNEEFIIDHTCDRIASRLKLIPGSRVFLVDNGSDDSTLTKMKLIASKNPQVFSILSDSKKGLGIAFRLGLKHLARENLSSTDWVVLAAADLPFDFSDADGLLQILPAHPDCFVIVGSKAHRQSKIQRSWSRKIASSGFWILRRAILGMKIKDTQGSIWIRGDKVNHLSSFKADDYFFAVELLHQATKLGPVLEIAVNLKSDPRPSRVNFLADSVNMFLQLWRMRSRLKHEARNGKST